jgi:hypothetical protein
MLQVVGHENPATFVDSECRTRLTSGAEAVRLRSLRADCRAGGDVKTSKQDQSNVSRWGPFTGRHLTIMFVAVVLGGVVVPATAWARVTFSNVAITDAKGVNRAKVDASGNLHTKANGTVIASDVNTPGRSVFNATLFVHFSNQSPFGTNPAISVPAGKRFVIRSVNIYATVPTGERVSDAVVNISDSTAHTFTQAFPVTFVGASGAVSGTDELASQNLTMLYAGGGTQIHAQAIRSASAGTGSVTFTLSGDLINCTPASACTAAEALNG